jgi:hypothetical protein
MAAPVMNGNCNTYFCFRLLHNDFLAHSCSLLGGGAGHAVFGRKSLFSQNLVYKFGLWKGGGGEQSAASASTLLTRPPLILPLRLRPLCFYPSDSAPFHSPPPTPPPCFYPSDSAPSASTPPTRPHCGGGGRGVLYVNVLQTVFVVTLRKL